MTSATLDTDIVYRALHGSRRAAGRIISLIENDDPSAEDILRSIYPHTGKAYTVGITGPPGAGKSTVVDEMVRVIRERDMTVGVLAIDPNSPFSGGAILGDRIRMMRHSHDSGVFIRSMGARGHLGGLAVPAQYVVWLFDAMGIDIVLVETVGVGQSELDVAGAADTTAVVIPPGLGDGVQAIKAGIMEVADIFVVNKSDHALAGKTVADIRELLRMDGRKLGWGPPIVRTVATQNEGVEELWASIERHREYLACSGELVVRRRRRLEREILSIATERLRRLILDPRTDAESFQKTLDDVLERHIDPFEAARTLLPAS